MLSQTLVEPRSPRLFSCMKVLEYIVGFSKLLLLLLAPPSSECLVFNINFYCAQKRSLFTIN